MSSTASTSDLNKSSLDSHLSQIIYLSSRSTSESSEPTITFSLAALSSLPESVSDEDLFAGLIDRCTPWVGEEGEKKYTLIILASEGEASSRARGSGFWLWRFRRIPRSFRKNLKRMYIVHPTRFTKTILNVVLPFLSPKSYRKVWHLDSLLLLYRTHGVSLAGIHLTMPLLLDESRVMSERPDLFPLSNKSRYPQPTPVDQGWFAGFRGIVGTAASYLPYAPTAESSSGETIGEGLYDASAETLVDFCLGVPAAMFEMREAIRDNSTSTEGIFRGTPAATLRPPLIALLSLPLSVQPEYPWDEIAKSDPYLLPKLLMRVFSSSPSPYIPSSAYPIIRRIKSPSDIFDQLLPIFSVQERQLLSHMVRTFRYLVSHESTTRMTPRNYAICFAPDLIRGDDPIDDLEMCLEPGKRLPPGLAAQRTTAIPPSDLEMAGNTLVGVLEIWIRDLDLVLGNRAF